MRVLGRFMLASAVGLLVLLIGVLSAMVLGRFRRSGAQCTARQRIPDAGVPRNWNSHLRSFIHCRSLLGAASARNQLEPGIPAQPKRPFFRPLDFAM